MPCCLWQGFDEQVFVIDAADGVVGLEGDGALAELASWHVLESRGGIPTFGFSPVGGDLAVDLDGDVLALDFDFVVEPLFVTNWGGVHDVFDRIETAGFLWVLVLGGVDLALVAIVWPAFLLELGVDVDAGVGSLLVGTQLDLGFENEVFEGGLSVCTNIKEVCTTVGGLNSAVFYDKGIGLLVVGLPAGEVLAIEHGNEAVFGLKAERECRREAEGEQCVFHEEAHLTQKMAFSTRKSLVA